MNTPEPNCIQNDLILLSNTLYIPSSVTSTLKRKLKDVVNSSQYFLGVKHLSSCIARNSFVVLFNCIHYLLADSHFYLQSSHLHCNTVLNQAGDDASRAPNKKGNRAFNAVFNCYALHVA